MKLLGSITIRDLASGEIYILPNNVFTLRHETWLILSVKKDEFPANTSYCQQTVYSVKYLSYSNTHLKIHSMANLFPSDIFLSENIAYRLTNV